MTTHRTLAILLSALVVPLLRAQPTATPPERPRFEVASIKPGSPAVRGIDLRNYPGGKIIVTQFTLEQLVESAFDVQRFQVTGAAGWIDSDRFDITAIPPAGSAASLANPPSPRFPMNDEQRQMLQSLLIDRFALKFHIEDREGPVYRLTRGTGPLALTAPADTTVAPYFLSLIRQGGVMDGEMTGGNLTMPFLAIKLGRYFERPVLDQTNLTGSFDIKLPAIDPTNTDIEGGIMDAVSRLGLKLKGARGPVHTIVIDSARPPTPN